LHRQSDHVLTCLALHLPLDFFFDYFLRYLLLKKTDRLTIFLSHSQHLQKLRRKEEKANNAGGDGAAACPSTPKDPGGRKKRVGSAAKKEPGSGTKRKPVDVSDDEEDSKTASAKKIKNEPVKKEEPGK
jgi:hypothetical protein